MKILYYDCFAGISGDMNLGAMIDLGVDRQYLLDELSKLKLDSEYEILIEKGIKNGIQGTKVDVVLKNQEEHSHKSHDHAHNHSHDQEHSHDHAHNHSHDHEHSHDHAHNHSHDQEHSHDHAHNHSHDHGHSHDHTHDHSHNHVHRNLKDIEAIIESSDLNENVKKLSIDMFMEVAKAEAKVHGKDLYDVHFHEVGAIDSIVDMVGAAICIDYIKPDKIMASPVEVGGGFVKCAHGLIPVPAPATIEILKGIPIKSGRVSFETTTPTGGAILASNVDEFVENVEFTIEKTGYGLGSRDLEIPNVLRVYLAGISKKKL